MYTRNIEHTSMYCTFTQAEAKQFLIKQSLCYVMLQVWRRTFFLSTLSKDKQDGYLLIENKI